MIRSRMARRALAGAALLCGATLGAGAQGADTAAATKVGDVAPDFTAAGATRYGVLRDPVRLSDFRGKTVVLAFFYKARTKG